MLRPYGPTCTKRSDLVSDDDDEAQRATAATIYALRQRWQSRRGKRAARASPLISSGLTSCVPAHESQVAG